MQCKIYNRKTIVTINIENNISKQIKSPVNCQSMFSHFFTQNNLNLGKHITYKI